MHGGFNDIVRYFMVVFHRSIETLLIQIFLYVNGKVYVQPAIDPRNTDTVSSNQVDDISSKIFPLVERKQKAWRRKSVLLSLPAFQPADNNSEIRF